MTIYDTRRDVLLQLRRPFRFFFSLLNVQNKEGSSLGHIERKLAIFSKQYCVYNEEGQEVYEIYGPFIRPWTFEIKQEGRVVGKITKKWSGLLKETFSDADNFGIEFPKKASCAEKVLLLGAVFLIDFCHFENKN